MTECNQNRLAFQQCGRREIVAEFNGECITSDAGALLLREVDEQLGIIARFADCFDDFRDADRLEHPVPQLLAQRIFGIALGYEDLNDHDQLRSDPLFATACGSGDPTGSDRQRQSDRGKALAGRSTLNRLELTPPGAGEQARYKKIAARHTKIERFFVWRVFAAASPAA